MAALAFELSRGALKAIKANQEDGEVVLQVHAVSSASLRELQQRAA